MGAGDRQASYPGRRLPGPGRCGRPRVTLSRAVVTLAAARVMRHLTAAAGASGNREYPTRTRNLRTAWTFLNGGPARQSGMPAMIPWAAPACQWKVEMDEHASCTLVCSGSIRSVLFGPSGLHMLKHSLLYKVLHC